MGLTDLARSRLGATSAPRGISRGLMATAAGDAAVLAGSTISLIIIARSYDSQGFASYALAYRLLAVLAPALVIGTGVSLPRLLPRVTDDQERMAYLWGAVGLVGIVITLLFAAVAPFAGRVTGVIFGSHSDKELLLATGVLIAGDSVFTLGYAYLRGSFAMVRANLLMAFNMSVVPIAAATLSHGITQVILITGLSWFLTTAVLVLPTLQLPSPTLTLRKIRELFDCGWPRVPGELALFGLLSVPPLVAVRLGGIREAGYLSLAVSMLALASAAVTPLSTVVLPHASYLFHQEAHGDVGNMIRRSFLLVAAITIPGLVVAELAMPWILPRLLGRSFVAATTPLRIIMIGMPAYLLFIALRSFIDAASPRALTMHYALAGFVVFAVVTALVAVSMSPAIAPSVGLVAGLWTLAGLTIREGARLARADRGHLGDGVSEPVGVRV